MNDRFFYIWVTFVGLVTLGVVGFVIWVIVQILAYFGVI